jgi:hypothetical protein
VFGGFGNDDIVADRLIFGNEGDDSIVATGAGVSDTAFGGLGNDSIIGNPSAQILQGDENNDTIRGGRGIDTISGGTGNDVFAYTFANPGQDEDGNNAAAGGPVELVTDVDWSADKFETFVNVTFATNTGAGTGADLTASANNAIAAAFASAGGGSAVVAAQFTFAGRTFVAIEQRNFGAFSDADDLLLDITGVTGTIGTSNFI